jgi:hypothetical protein
VDLLKKITVDAVKSWNSKNTNNTMVDQLNSFASEVTRVAAKWEQRQLESRPKSKEWQALKDLTDNVNFMAAPST